MINGFSPIDGSFYINNKISHNDMLLLDIPLSSSRSVTDKYMKDITILNNKIMKLDCSNTDSINNIIYNKVYKEEIPMVIINLQLYICYALYDVTYGHNEKDETCNNKKNIKKEQQIYNKKKDIINYYEKRINHGIKSNLNPNILLHNKRDFMNSHFDPKEFGYLPLQKEVANHQNVWRDILISIKDKFKSIKTTLEYDNYLLQAGKQVHTISIILYP
jgi:hypothetical protein